MISDYLDTLAGALSFDRSLSGRVRQEVEDHLRGAAAADPPVFQIRNITQRATSTAALLKI